MGHSIGAVKFNDDKILYYEYNGSVSVVLPKLYETEDDVHDNWRENPAADCVCGNDEAVRIMTTYGGGFSWNGRACRSCYAITDGFMPFNDCEAVDYDKRAPEWSPWKKEKEGAS